MKRNGFRSNPVARGLGAALAASLLAVMMAMPAHAETVTAGCGTYGGSLEGHASYAVDGAWHNWYRFSGLITGNNRGSNNIEFYFYQDYQLNWQHWSPDNVRGGRWYSASANIWVPESSAEQVQFWASFDIPWGSDPECQAFSAVV